MTTAAHQGPERRTRSKPTLTIVGATGAVGTVMLSLLSVRKDIWGDIRLVASEESAGRRLTVRGESLEVTALSEDSFDDVDVALFHVPEDVARTWAPIAASHGAVVVDNSPAFRADPDVPLVVPEVNAADVGERRKGIIASPTCITMPVMVAVGALHHSFGLESLVIASYQAASGAGQAGIDTLYDQVAKVAGHREIGTRAGDVRRIVGEELGPFAAPLAYNVVPWSGDPGPDGWSSEELAVRQEARKILGLPQLAVSATCVRVPVVSVNSATVHARFTKPVDIGVVRELLRDSPGMVLFDEPENHEFPTPADVVGTDPTWVGRLRQALDDPYALDMFVCGDNLRKGAALNAAQIAEVVAEELAG
ncbi:MAG TPA: aspartate-semialdehyde dehydrogenase [Actinopolymorphaceae bacterium]